MCMLTNMSMYVCIFSTISISNCMYTHIYAYVYVDIHTSAISMTRWNSWRVTFVCVTCHFQMDQFVCIHIYMYWWMYIYAYKCHLNDSYDAPRIIRMRDVWLYVYTLVHVYVYVYICISDSYDAPRIIRMRDVALYVYTLVHVYVYTLVHVYVYVYICTSWSKETPSRGGFPIYYVPDQEPGGRGPPLKNHPQNWW